MSLMKTRIKLILAIAVALILTTGGSPHVFIANTPTVRPHLDRYIASRLKNVWRGGNDFVARLFRKSDTSTVAAFKEELKKKEEKLANTAFTQLSSGVYAKDEGEVHSLVEIRLDEMEFIEHTFVVDGKEIKIRIPKDQSPPPQSVMENMFGN